MKKYNESANRSSRNGKQYRTGSRIPASGTYRVIHGHAMQTEVKLQEGNLFPQCAQCTKVVEFEMVRAPSAESMQERFRLLMQAQAQ